MPSPRRGFPVRDSRLRGTEGVDELGQGARRESKEQSRPRVALLTCCGLQPGLGKSLPRLYSSPRALFTCFFVKLVPRAIGPRPGQSAPGHGAAVYGSHKVHVPAHKHQRPKAEQLFFASALWAENQGQRLELLRLPECDTGGYVSAEEQGMVSAVPFHTGPSAPTHSLSPAVCLCRARTIKLLHVSSALVNGNPCLGRSVPDSLHYEYE
jgi:hypothetical protein